MPCNIIPQNIRAVFNYKVGTTFTWMVEKHKRLEGDVRCQFICDLHYPSCHNSRQRHRLLMKAEEPHTPPWHKWRVAGQEMKDGIDGRRAEGHGRAAGRLADLWPRNSHVSPNFLLDWIRLGRLLTPLCVNHTHTDAWTHHEHDCVFRWARVDTRDLSRVWENVRSGLLVLSALSS